MKVGDIVTRNSHQNDYFFVIKDIKKEKVLLSCISHRLLADAPYADIVPVDRESLFSFKRFFRSGAELLVESVLEERRKKYKAADGILSPGRVLHVDGDGDYLKMCLSYYGRLGVPAVGRQLKEVEQPQEIEKILRECMPDILILTGHDALRREQGREEIYTSSGFFAQAVRKARSYQSSKDALVIFAGACQSNYKELMEAGANFASSPDRIFIHALDPVFVAERISYASTEEVLSLQNAVRYTITGQSGIGGVSSRGMMRFLSPAFA